MNRPTNYPCNGPNNSTYGGPNDYQNTTCPPQPYIPNAGVPVYGGREIVIVEKENDGMKAAAIGCCSAACLTAALCCLCRMFC